MNTLLPKITSREARVGVVGLGYVGLPLLLEFRAGGFPVVGFDIDARKIDALKAGQSYIRHIEADRIREAFAGAENRADATDDFARIGECDAVIICVPTPLTKQREPDMSYIESTARALAPGLREGQLVCLESTTYPGTTDEVLIPLLEQGRGLKAGRDFLVAFSPEREDPSNPSFRTATIPKVVGGHTPAAGVAACALYGAVIVNTVPVSSCRAAEATKLLENIFRSVNIALVNEMKVVLTAMGIDVWEVIRAASTKPFGFMPFYPGPGLGGHCIPIDPFYLTWKAREYGVPTKFIELAGEINTAMPDYVILRALRAMNERGRTLKGARVLLVGLAYKKNVDDDRESPTYVLWEKLRELGAEVAYYDPYCPTVRPTREHPQFAGIRSRTEAEAFGGGFDLVLIATAHDGVDHDRLAATVPLVIDTRGVCAPRANIVRA
jgi:UDP-N-acetyl-D-glucosamine dehydrogenase